MNDQRRMTYVAKFCLYTAAFLVLLSYYISLPSSLAGKIDGDWLDISVEGVDNWLTSLPNATESNRGTRLDLFRPYWRRLAKAMNLPDVPLRPTEPVDESESIDRNEEKNQLEMLSAVSQMVVASNSTQHGGAISGFLLSPRGLPTLRTPWDPGFFYAVPLNGTFPRFPNTIPHSFPSASQVQTFLAKIQGVKPILAGAWQERREATFEEIVLPPQQPSIFRNFTLEAFLSWRSAVYSVALTKEMVVEPLRQLLIDNIRAKGDIYFHIFQWYRERFPLPLIVNSSFLP
uniref:Uncharacterized protein n=1 Tax=Neospora caninum (strain Liverpool) TaxID=572307 RepID=A0A0F7U5C5_NEOCL|nr:TPA: hypothetical protein BN1204_008365 [Neospora caninum Liverpool]